MKIELSQKDFQDLVINPENHIKAERFDNVQRIVTAVNIPHAGRFEQENIFLPNIDIIIPKATFTQPVYLKSNSEEGRVNINVTLKGSNSSKFEGIKNQIHNNTYEHNILFIKETSGLHLFPAKEFESFHMSFSPGYFHQLLEGEGEPVSSFLKNIENDKIGLLSPKHARSNPEILAIISNIRNCMMPGKLGRLYIESKIIELLCLQIESFKGMGDAYQVKGNQEKVLFNNIKSFLDENFLQDLSLKFICKTFGINDFKLKKGFKQCFGVSVFEYIFQKRMQKAKQLIEKDNLTILQVSEIVGYSHPNHFTHAFKRNFGMPPSKILTA